MLSWKAVSVTIRLYFVFQLCAALKKVHSLELLHRDLKPHNMMVDGNLDLKLADFGGTKDEASIAAGTNQTGVFSWGWADANARAAKYDKTSEVYAFGLNAHYIIYAESLFSRDDVTAYLQNSTKSEKVKNDRYMLQGLINKCL